MGTQLFTLFLHAPTGSLAEGDESIEEPKARDSS